MSALQTSNSSIFTAPGYASNALEHYQLAIEVDPDYLRGHIGLFQFYLTAPRIAGGSQRKAEAVLEKQIKRLSSEEYQLRRLRFLSDTEQELLDYTLSLAMKIDNLSHKITFYTTYRLQQLGRFDNAREVFSSLSKQVIEEVNSHYPVARL